MRGHILSITGAVLAFAAGAANADNEKATKEAFFGTGSSSLDAKAKQALDEAASEAKRMPGATVVINGHTDPRGTAPYNVGLSIRRAENARDYIICKGVDPDHIVLAYYGEAKAGRNTLAQDRRVTVELTKEPLFVVIDRAFPEAIALTWKEPTTTAQIEGPRTSEVARR